MQRASGTLTNVSVPNACNGYANNVQAVSDASLQGIAGGAYQTVPCKPFSGVLNQRKYMPLRFIPITVELSLVDVPLDHISGNLSGYSCCCCS